MSESLSELFKTLENDVERLAYLARGEFLSAKQKELSDFFLNDFSGVEGLINDSAFIPYQMNVTPYTNQGKGDGYQVRIKDVRDEDTNWREFSVYVMNGVQLDENKPFIALIGGSRKDIDFSSVANIRTALMGWIVSNLDVNSRQHLMDHLEKLQSRTALAEHIETPHQ